MYGMGIFAAMLPIVMCLEQSKYGYSAPVSWIVICKVCNPAALRLILLTVLIRVGMKTLF
jgi:hypothetical protein